MFKNYKPFGKRVLITPTETVKSDADEKLITSIDSSQHKEITGTICEIGTPVTELSVGQLVLFRPSQASYVVKLPEGVKYLLNEENILMYEPKQQQ